jgi:hypothetical protein
LQLGLTDENGQLIIEELLPGAKVTVELPPVADFYRPVKREIEIGTETQPVRIEMIGVRI